MESYGEGDIQDGGVAFLKEFHGFLQAEADDVLHAGHVRVLFEKTHEIIVAEMAKSGQFRNGDGFGIVEFDVVQHLFQFVRGFAQIRGGVFLAVLKQYKKQLQKQRLQSQFIACRFFFIQSMGLLENLQKRGICRVILLHQIGHGDLCP